MNWSLTDDHLALRDGVRDALRKADDGWAVLEDAADLDLEDIDRALLAEEAGRACVDGPLVETLGGDDVDRRSYVAAAYLVGLAEAMVAMAVEHAGLREQFGRPVGAFQAVRHPLADVATAVAHARPVVWAAAWSVAAERPDAPVRCSSAKVLAAQAAESAARVSLQTHGAMGYTTEHRLHRWLERTWAMSRAFGDITWHRRRIGEAILKSTKHTQGERP